MDSKYKSELLNLPEQVKYGEPKELCGSHLSRISESLELLKSKITVKKGNPTLIDPIIFAQKIIDVINEALEEKRSLDDEYLLDQIARDLSLFYRKRKSRPIIPLDNILVLILETEERMGRKLSLGRLNGTSSKYHKGGTYVSRNRATGKESIRSDD